VVEQEWGDILTAFPVDRDDARLLIRCLAPLAGYD